MRQINLSECPLCKSTEFHHFLTCKDYTKSQEAFNIQQCKACSFTFTSPRPDQNTIGSYYDSEKYISHTGKSSELLDSVYLLARNFTLRWKVNLVKKFSSPKTLLDFGCGTGEFLYASQKQKIQCTGVEPSVAAHTKAKKKTKLDIVSDIDGLSTKKFDAITLWHVLEHVPHPTGQISELRSLLTDNGTLFVAVPNYTAYDQQVYKEYWAAYDLPRHYWHFTKETMTLLADQAGLTIQEIIPMKLDAYYVSILSQKYSLGKHTIAGLIKALYTAFLSNLKAKKRMNYSSLIYIMTKK